MKIFSILLFSPQKWKIKGTAYEVDIVRFCTIFLKMWNLVRVLCFVVSVQIIHCHNCLCTNILKLIHITIYKCGFSHLQLELILQKLWRQLWFGEKLNLKYNYFQTNIKLRFNFGQYRREEQNAKRRKVAFHFWYKCIWIFICIVFLVQTNSEIGL